PTGLAAARARRAPRRSRPDSSRGTGAPVAFGSGGLDMSGSLITDTTIRCPAPWRAPVGCCARLLNGRLSKLSATGAVVGFPGLWYTCHSVCNLRLSSPLSRSPRWQLLLAAKCFRHIPNGLDHSARLEEVNLVTRAGHHGVPGVCRDARQAGM